jgi:hypothetical protein
MGGIHVRLSWWLALALATAGIGAYVLVQSMTAKGAAAVTQQFMTLPGGAFHAGDDSCVYNHDNYSGDIVDGNGCYYVTGIQLPNGATVTGFRVEYDSSSGASANVHLEENDAFGDHEDLAALSIGGGCSPSFPSSCSATDTAIESPGVTNQNRSYGIWFNPSGTGFVFYRATVAFVTGAATVSKPDKIANPSKNPK